MATNYQEQAKQMLQPQYDQRITALRNALNQNVLNLDQSKTGINQNFDTQVENQNRQNVLNKQNFTNSMLSRGLGRSSIQTTGTAGLDSQNSRLLNQIGTARTGALNDIEAQKALLNNNLENTIAQMNADKDNEAMKLGMELDDKAFSRSMQERQLAASKAKSSGSSSPKFNATLFNQSRQDAFGQMYQAYSQLLQSDPEAAGKFLRENSSDMISASDKKTYDGVMKEYTDYMDNYNAAQLKKQRDEAAKAKANEPSSISKAASWLKNGFKNLFKTGDDVWW